MQDNTMPQAVAKANYVRIAPRKVQIVLDLIRNQPALPDERVRSHF